MKRRIKQLLSALLIMTILLQMGVFAYAETQEAAESGTDENIVLLNKLGFVNETYGPKTGDDSVTRAQFASMLAFARGFDGEYVASRKGFIDIPADYWCEGQIYALHETGIIHGTSDDMFSPDSYITYPQVVKCLVSLLGYDIMAEQAGGYPDGYIKVASQIGLSGGNREGAADFKTVAKLLTKAMDTELLELKVSGNEIGYGKAQNQTPLKKYNDIYYDKGIMTDNGITTLTGNTRVGDGSVAINNVVLDSTDCDVTQYLGYKLKYYYKNNDDHFKLLFVIPVNTNVVELMDTKIDASHPDFSTRKIYYESTRGNSYYKIDEFADVIYNGKAYPAFDVDTLKLKQGTLTLIDNDDDGDYEVILVNEYYNIYVSGVDTGNEIIYGKYGNSVEYGKYIRSEFYTSDGAATTINAVSLKQVLSVYESQDNSYIKIVISTLGVAGKVDTITNGVTKTSNMTAAQIATFKDRAWEMRIVVEEEELSFSRDYIDAVAIGYQSTYVPEIGISYVFHLDANRKVAGIEDPTGKQYAYLIKAFYINRDGLTRAKLFMDDSTILTTVFAKKVTVNGTRYKGAVDGADGVCNCPDFYDANGVFLPQAVKVRLNNLGEIIEVETATALTNSYGYDKTKFTMCYSGTSKYAGPSQRTFTGTYTLANDILIFNVPPLSDFDESELSIISASSLTEGSAYPVSLYDADESWACKLAVIQAGESSDWFLAPCVIESITTELVDEQPTKVARGLESTNTATYIEGKPGVFPAELAPGDIVRVVKGVNNKVLRMQILASATRNTESFYDPLDGTEWSTYYGQLYARSDTGFTLTMDGGQTVEAMPFNDTPVNVYDMQTKKARRGTRNDMVMNCPIREDGRIDLTNCDSMIYVFKRRGYARGIIVVKYK